MKARLDAVTPPNFLTAAERALKASGAVLGDIGYLCGAGHVRDGQLVLLLAAGTGYTWTASVVRWRSP